MTYGTQIIKNGAIIRTSKNLRGMRDYARVSAVARVECTPAGEVNGALRVMYLSLIHISEPTRPCGTSRMPSSA